MPTASTLVTALARNHAEESRADDRDFCRAAAEATHRRHRDIGEEVSAAGARQYLAEDRERDNDKNRDLKGCCRWRR